MVDLTGLEWSATKESGGKLKEKKERNEIDLQKSLKAMAWKPCWCWRGKALMCYNRQNVALYYGYRSIEGIACNKDLLVKYTSRDTPQGVQWMDKHFSYKYRALGANGKMIHQFYQDKCFCG